MSEVRSLTEPVAVMLPIQAPRYVLRLWKAEAWAISWTEWDERHWEEFEILD